MKPGACRRKRDIHSTRENGVDFLHALRGAPIEKTTPIYGPKKDQERQHSTDNTTPATKTILATALRLAIIGIAFSLCQGCINMLAHLPRPRYLCRRPLNRATCSCRNKTPCKPAALIKKVRQGEQKCLLSRIRTSDTSQIPRARMRRGGRGKAPDGEQLSGTICHRGEPCGRACEFARAPRAARRLAARAAFDSCRFFSEVEIAPGHHHIFYKPMRNARMLGQNYASVPVRVCVLVSDAVGHDICCERVILLLFACER